MDDTGYALSLSSLDVAYDQRALAATLGFLAHQAVFIRGEWHFQAFSCLLAHFFILVAVLCLFLRTAGPLNTAVYAALELAVCYAAGLYLSIAAYRIFFHRLRRFPGPLLGRLTKLWHLYKCLGSQNHLLLEQLRLQYGDIVRTGACTLPVK